MSFWVTGLSPNLSWKDSRIAEMFGDCGKGFDASVYRDLGVVSCPYETVSARYILPQQVQGRVRREIMW